MNFFQLLGLRQTPASQRNLGKLFLALDGLLQDHSEHEVQYLTGLSGLLGKVAFADRDISHEELEKIKAILVEQGTVSPTLFESLLAVIQEHTKTLSGIEDSRYSQILNEICSPEERFAVLRSLFAVAAANNSIDSDEERELALIAKALRISAVRFSELRSEFKEYLDVLKDQPSVD